MKPPDQQAQPAAEELLSEVYTELRHMAAAKMAHERAGQTLQATALVHEAWMRLADSDQDQWTSRQHFFGAAAEAMRRILVENARRKMAARRGHNPRRVELRESLVGAQIPDEDVMAVHEALDGLAEVDAVAAELVKLRFFVGLTHAEAAEVLGLSRHEADGAWIFARSWLYEHIELS